jgi:hypothetical protein
MKKLRLPIIKVPSAVKARKSLANPPAVVGLGCRSQARTRDSRLQGMALSFHYTKRDRTISYRTNALDVIEP